jgi:hypothetical protein
VVADTAAATAQAEAAAAAELARKALEELNALQKQHDDAIAEQQAKADDPNGSVVSKGRAVAELAKLQSKDPLPLDRARINQGATVRKAERAAKKAASAAEEATEARNTASNDRQAAEESRVRAVDARGVAESSRKGASQAREAAEAGREAASQSRQQAEGGLAEAEAAFGAAEAFLDEARRNGEGAGQGSLWWIDRELFEKKKYLPTRAGGIGKTHGASNFAQK